MKAKTIKKLRKKIQSKGYLEYRMRKFAKICSMWDNFLFFKCDEFFVGNKEAEMNYKIYQKNALRIEKKYSWYKQRLKNNN